MKHDCPLCGEVTEEQICDTCADIIEFGYPSFPAYMLDEKKTEEPELATVVF